MGCGLGKNSKVNIFSIYFFEAKCHFSCMLFLNSYSYFLTDDLINYPKGLSKGLREKVLSIFKRIDVDGSKTIDKTETAKYW